MAFTTHSDTTALNIADILINVILFIAIAYVTSKCLFPRETSRSTRENASGPRFLPNEIVILIINALVDDFLDEASENPVNWFFTTRPGLHKHTLSGTTHDVLEYSSVIRRQVILGDVAAVNRCCRHLVTRKFARLPLLQETGGWKIMIRAWVCYEFDSFEPFLLNVTPVDALQLPPDHFPGAVQNLQLDAAAEKHIRLLEELRDGVVGLPSLKCLILLNREQVELPALGPPKTPQPPRRLTYRDIDASFGHPTGVGLLEPLWRRGVRILIKSNTILPNNQPHEELVRMSRGRLGVKLLDCAYMYSRKETSD